MAVPPSRALYGGAQARLLPDPRGIPGWLHSHRDLGPRFLTENVTLGVGRQVVAFIVAALNGLAAMGAIRGAQMLTGPVVSLLMGIAQVAVPETVRSLDGGRAALHRPCMTLSLGLGAVSLAWGIVIMAVFPFGIGELLLGSVWPGTYALAPGVIVAATEAYFVSSVRPASGGLEEREVDERTV